MTAEPTKRRRVLLVEDNPIDVFLIREAIQLQLLDVELRVLSDGEKAIGFIDIAGSDGDGSCPELVLLDLNLPIKSGEEVLAHLRANHRWGNVPVVIISSAEPRGEWTLRIVSGDVRYFRKPGIYDQYMDLGKIIADTLGLRPTPATN